MSSHFHCWEQVSHAFSDATAGNSSAVTHCHLASWAESADDVKERGSSSDTKVQTNSDKHYLIEEKEGGMGIGQVKSGEDAENKGRKGNVCCSNIILPWAEFSADFTSAKHILYS